MNIERQGEGLIWIQRVLDANGETLKERKVELSGRLEDQIQAYRTFIAESGGDVKATFMAQLQESSRGFEHLLGALHRAGSRYEVEQSSRVLRPIVDLIKRLTASLSGTTGPKDT